MDDLRCVRAQNEIYQSMGRVLIGMVEPEYEGRWEEIDLRVDHASFEQAPGAYAIRVTAVLEDGFAHPLIARPELVDLCRDLDLLCREQSPKWWKAIDCRITNEADGPSFECKFIYPDASH